MYSKKPPLGSRTALVDEVARNVVQSRMRGCVLGQNGMWLDREALRKAAQLDMPIEDFCQELLNRSRYFEQNP